MADLITDYGLDELRSFTTDTCQWLLLLASYAPARTDHFTAAIAAAEVTGAGYARATVGSPARTVNTTAHRVEYSCSAPSLGTIAAGETYRWLALSKRVTTDGDSPIIAYFDLGATATAGVPVNPVLGAGGIILYADQG